MAEPQVDTAGLQGIIHRDEENQVLICTAGGCGRAMAAASITKHLYRHHKIDYRRATAIGQTAGRLTGMLDPTAVPVRPHGSAPVLHLAQH